MYAYCQHCGSPDMCETCHTTFYDDAAPVERPLTVDVVPKQSDKDSKFLSEVSQQTAVIPSIEDQYAEYLACFC